MFWFACPPLSSWSVSPCPHLRNGRTSKHPDHNHLCKDGVFHVFSGGVITLPALCHLVAMQVAFPLCTRAALKWCKAEVTWKASSHLWRVPSRHLQDHSLMYRSDLLPESLPCFVAEWQFNHFCLLGTLQHSLLKVVFIRTPPTVTLCNILCCSLCSPEPLQL